MANRITYTVGFDADTTQLKSALQEAQTLLQGINKNSEGLAITEDMQLASQSARELLSYLQAAYNTDTGQLDLSKFRQSLADSNTDLQTYAARLQAIGPQGEQAFYAVANAITSVEQPIRRSSELLDKLWTTMKNTMRWQLTSSMLNSFVGGLQSAYGYAQDLDESLNNIRIVTSKSSEDMAEFAEQANKAAKALSTTTTDYTDASLIYYQQGLDDEEVQQRTDTTIKMANVTGDSAQTVSDQMTAIWNNFYDGSRSLESYADAMVALGAATASSSDEIAQGVEAFAAVAETVGLSYDYAVTALATLTAETRQSASTVGTSLRTIFARLQGLAQDETQDDGTTLNKYSQALANIGVSIKDASGGLKDMDDILDETAAKWDTLSQAQQVALAQTVAGVRQYTSFVALMDNWDAFQSNLLVAQNSEGALEEQAKIYSESWEAARDRVKASAQDIYDSLLDEDLFISADDALSGVLDTIADVVDGLGGLKGVVVTLGGVLTNVFSEKMAQSLRDMAYEINRVSGQEDALNTRLKQNMAQLAGNVSGGSFESFMSGSDEDYLRTQYQQKDLQLQIEIYNKSKDISDEQYKQLTYQRQYLAQLGEVVAQYATYVKQTKEAADNVRDSISTTSEDFNYAGTNGHTRGTNKGKKSYETVIGRGEQDTEIWQNSAFAAVGNNLSDVLNDKNVTYLTKLLTLYQELGAQSANIKVLGEYTKNLGSTIGKTNFDVDSLKNTYNFLAQAYNSLGGEETFNIVTEDEKIDLKEMQALVEKLAEAFEKLNIQAEDAKGKIKEATQPFVKEGHEEEAEKRFQDIDEVSDPQGTSRGNQQLNEYDLNQQFNQVVDSMTKKTQDWANSLVTAGQALMSVFAIANSIKQLGSIWSDEDLTFGEKLTQSFSSLASIIMVVTPLMSKIPAILKEINVENSAGIVAAAGHAIAEGNLGIAFGVVAAAAQKAAAGILNVLKTALPIVAAVVAITVAIKAVSSLIDALILTQEEATEAIQDATDAYEEQASALDDLKSELEDVQEQIKELNEQDTLTVVEKEELDKLKREQAYLEKQIKLQEKLTQAAQKTQAETIEDNYAAAYGRLGAPELPTYYGYNDADVWFEDMTANLDKSSAEYQEYSARYAEWAEENEEITAEWLSENSEAIQQAEEDYEAYIEAITSGAIDRDDDKLSSIQGTLSKVRQASYSDAEYQQIFLEPVLDTAAVDRVSDQLYNTLANGDIADAAGYISEAIKKELMYAGISVDEFLNYINDRVDDTKEKIEDKFGDFDFDDLTSDDWEVLMDINLENFDSVEELKDFLDHYQDNDININVDGLEELQELLDVLNSQESSLEDALEDYKDQGYLTMDQVQDLIAADESYAAYITKAEDGSYALTNRAIQDFQNLEALEGLALDEQLATLKSQYDGSTQYAQTYVDMWDDLINKVNKANDAVEQYSFTNERDAELFVQRTEEIKEQTQAYADGIITASQYFNAIQERLEGVKSGFYGLNDELDNTTDKTDLYEETFSVAVSSIADGLNDLNKKFQRYEINMDEYSEGVIDGLKAIISAYSGMYEDEIELKDGVWDYKDSVDEATRANEELGTVIDNLNGYEKQIEDAEEFLELTDIITENFNFIAQFSDEAGRIDFGSIDLDNNFSEVTQEYKNMVDNVTAYAAKLESENETLYKEWIQSCINRGLQLDNGLESSSDDLHDAMIADTSNGAAVMEGSMLECGATIGDVTTAAGNVLTALGDLISNFDYTIEFTPTLNKGSGSLLNWILDPDTNSYSPGSLSLKITGEDGSGGKVSALGAALAELGTDLTTMGNSVTGGTEDRKGIWAFGNDNVNPDTLDDAADTGYETDNIRDKSSSSGSSSDNEGTVYDEEDEKILDDVLERYHEINREIEDQEDLLDDLDEATERAFGASKIANYNKKLAELTKQQENYNSKLEEAENYLNTVDKPKLEELYEGYDLIYDENGEIQGYDDLIAWSMEEYNEVVRQYNAFLEDYNTLTKDGQEARQEEYDNWQAALSAADTLYEARMAAIEQYEDTLDEIMDINDNIEDNLREIEDTKLEEIEYRLDVVVTVKDMEDDLRQLTRDMAESFSDALYHGIEVAKIDEKGMWANVAMLDEYQQTYNEYMDLLDNATEYTDVDQIMSDLEDLEGQIIDTAEALLEWVESLEDLLPDAIDAARERFDMFIDQLEHNETVLDTIKELYSLQGVTYKTMQGYNTLQNVSSEKLEAQVAEAQLQQEWYERARVELEEAEAALEASEEGTAEYDILKANRDALLDEYNEALESMLSSAEEAMETAQEIYTTALEKTLYDFDQLVSNGTGLDLLSEKYDHYIEEEERYLDTVNEAYEVASWYNKLQADIDDTTSSTMKAKLQALQEEIDARREGNTLSEYDLEILEAKYAVLQAEMELEEAQNTKNDLRLVRDSNGNWNYQYTADADAIDSAENDLLDAENNWYNIAKQQVEDVTGEIISTWEECKEKIEEIYSDMTLTDEERAAQAEEIYAYYTEKIEYLENEKQIAIADMTEAGNAALLDMAILFGDTVSDLTGVTSEEIEEIIAESGASIIDLVTADSETLEELVGDNTELLDLFENTYAEDLEAMTQSTTDFESMLNDTLDQAQADFEEYQAVVSTVAEATGTDLDSLAYYTDEVTDSTDLCREAGLEAADAMWDELESVRELSEGYAELADSVWEYIYALAELAGDTVTRVAHEAVRVDSSSSSSSSGYSASTDYAALIEAGLAGGYITYGDSTYNALTSQRENKITSEGLESDYYTVRGDEADEYFSNYSNTGTSMSESEFEDELSKLPGFATGGYTGDFNSSDGKLALLHEKELVLNQEDTANILSAVSAVRLLDPELLSAIETALDSGAATALMSSALDGTGSSIMANTGTLEQYVTIEHVEFPGVVSATEIQDAFASIVNDASQWAQRRKS